MGGLLEPAREGGPRSSRSARAGAFLFKDGDDIGRNLLLFDLDGIVTGSRGDRPGVDVPPIEARKGDDATDVLSISDAFIGGEDPNGDGFGGELLELRLGM